MNKYDPLENHLVKSGQDVITMSFAELEAILGAPLPHTAYHRNEWWGNEKSSGGHVQARAWMGAGYTVRADRAAQVAVFTRINP